MEKYIKNIALFQGKIKAFAAFLGRIYNYLLFWIFDDIGSFFRHLQLI